MKHTVYAVYVCVCVKFCWWSQSLSACAVLPGLAFLRLKKQIWPFLNSIEVHIVKTKIFFFLKTEYDIFQLQAPGNPAHVPDRRRSITNHGQNIELQTHQRGACHFSAQLYFVGGLPKWPQSVQVSFFLRCLVIFMATVLLWGGGGGEGRKKIAELLLNFFSFAITKVYRTPPDFGAKAYHFHVRPDFFGNAGREGGRGREEGSAQGPSCTAVSGRLVRPSDWAPEQRLKSILGPRKT